jgi:hypothetical protein
MRTRVAATVLGLVLSATPALAQGTPSKEVERLKALKAFCEGLDEDLRTQISECRALDDPAYYEMLLQRAEDEIPTRSRFLRWIHLDGPWVPMSSGMRMYGVVGMHVVVAQLGGRFFVFGPPGAMIVAQRTGSGWTVRPAMTWGLSVYLRDFRVPGTPREAQLFVNLGRAWMTGSHRNGIDMVGVSVTWKK